MNLLSDPIQVRLIDGELAIRVCTAIESNRISIEERTSGDWTTLWDASGSAVLVSGSEVTTQTLGDVFANLDIAENPTGEVGDELVVVVYGADDNLTSSFILDESATNGHWIDPDGANRRSCASD